MQLSVRKLIHVRDAIPWVRCASGNDQIDMFDDDIVFRMTLVNIQAIIDEFLNGVSSGMGKSDDKLEEGAASHCLIVRSQDLRSYQKQAHKAWRCDSYLQSETMNH